MIVRALIQNPTEIAATWLALGLFDKQETPPEAIVGSPAGDLVTKLIASKDVGGSVGDVTPILGSVGISAERLVVFGLGTKEKFGQGAAFDAGLALGKKLSGQPREIVSAIVPKVTEVSNEHLLGIATSLIAGVLVGVRGPDLRKKEPSRHAFGELRIVATPASGIGLADLEGAVKRGEIIAEVVNLARELANTPPSEKAPPVLAERMGGLARNAGLRVEIWNRERIESERFGGLLGVSAGSDQPPSFVILEYKGGGGQTPIALVGKGVTFDSGGLSLKPTASMEDMKSDMTGAAVVLATMCAIAKMGAKRNVIGYLALTENMTGGRAMKLGDVLTMRNGKTVEVLNTDAEGRLILADALSYAVERSPARILDLATLTGACMVALGTKYTGLFSNDDGFAGEIACAAAESGERVWRLPLDDDFFDLLKSPVADFKNVGGKYGGAVTAAKFLEQFVGKTPWVHLDIAGPSWVETESSTQHAGGTGCLVRTLIQWLMA